MSRDLRGGSIKRGGPSPTTTRPMSATTTPAAAAPRRIALPSAVDMGADDFVVVAAGEKGFDQRQLGGHARPSPHESGTRATSISAETPEAPQSLARSPASPSETSIAAEA